MINGDYFYDLIRTGIGDQEEQTKEFINNFNPNICSYITPFGQSLVQKAISSKKYEIAKFLIEQKCNLNHQDNRRNTLLHYILDGYNKKNIDLYDQMIEMLLGKEIDFDLENQYGNQPLWTAIMNANVPLVIIQKLLEMGTDPYHKNKAGRSPYDMVKEFNIPEINEIFNPYVR